MAKRYIITLTASNRVGILAAVATALAELGGELHEVKQTLLDRFFTMILSADFPEHRDEEVIVDHLQGMGERYGIEITLKNPNLEIPPGRPDGEVTRHRLSLGGRDRPGLLSLIAARIARDGIDVAEMRAGRIDDDRSFEITMDLAAPTTADLARLIADLEEIGRDVGLVAWFEEQGGGDANLESQLRWKH